MVSVKNGRKELKKIPFFSPFLPMINQLKGKMEICKWVGKLSLWQMNVPVPDWTGRYRWLPVCVHR